MRSNAKKLTLFVCLGCGGSLRIRDWKNQSWSILINIIELVFFNRKSCFFQSWGLISFSKSNQHQTNIKINIRPIPWSIPDQDQINTRSISSQWQCQPPQRVHQRVHSAKLSPQRVHSKFTAQNSPHSEFTASLQRKTAPAASSQRVQSAKQSPERAPGSKSNNIRSVPNQYPINTRSISDRYQDQYQTNIKINARSIRSLSGLITVLNFKPVSSTIFNNIEHHFFFQNGDWFFQYRILRVVFIRILRLPVSRWLAS